MNNISTTYKGRPCCSTEMTVGNTVFTVITVQSEQARETAYQKIKKLILTSASSQRLTSESTLNS